MQAIEFVDAASRMPWIYGGGPGGFRGIDCVLFFANWGLATTGVDPAADKRGTYSNHDEAEDIIERAGGYIGLMRSRLERINFTRVIDQLSHDLSDGDIGVLAIKLPGGDAVQTPALFCRNSWIIPNPRRFIAVPVRTQYPLIIWSPPQ